MLSCGDSGDSPAPAPAPTLTLSGNALTFGGDYQVVTVTSNTAWGVSSDQTWCTFSPAEGTGNTDITITVAANTTTSARTATITVVTTSGTPPQTKTIAVTQATDYPLGGLADRITIEGSGPSAKLVITRNPTDAGLFFKFGSVVGIYSGNHANTVLPSSSAGDTFDSGDVAFNPTATAAYSAWSDVPYTSGRGEIEHTLASVQAGKGDPCRLVGYAAQQIKDATAVLDNKTWRLPTLAENQAFTGQTTNGSYTAHWWTAALSPFSGVAGGEFPSNVNGDVSKFLPAAGYRFYSEGSFIDVGTNGFYWSATPDGGNGYHLYFGSTYVYPMNSDVKMYGLSVRCVRQ